MGQSTVKSGPSFLNSFSSGVRVFVEIWLYIHFVTVEILISKFIVLKQVFVSAYRGKDARYSMELNLGPTIVGDQESGWLYNQVRKNYK